MALLHRTATEARNLIAESLERDENERVRKADRKALKESVDKIVSEACKSINRECLCVTTVNPYKAQLLLELVIEELEGRV